MVSIHALLAECDRFRFPGGVNNRSFNPRTPCGVRPIGLFGQWNRQAFQSTHSLRSATRQIPVCRPADAVSIHALLAECDSFLFDFPHPQGGFNPRTPCGVRLPGTSRRLPRTKFQSTHSLRSATRVELLVGCQVAVSIHALLAECDQGRNAPPGTCRCFNPRTPCGVRPASLVRMTPTPQFQSTHSLRSATQGGKWLFALSTVSIHALLAECDILLVSFGIVPCGFNPRTPCGVRHA